MIDAVEGSRSKYQFASKDSQLNQDCDCVADDLAVLFRTARSSPLRRIECST